MSCVLTTPRALSMALSRPINCGHGTVERIDPQSADETPSRVAGRRVAGYWEGDAVSRFTIGVLTSEMPARPEVARIAALYRRL